MIVQFDSLIGLLNLFGKFFLTPFYTGNKVINLSEVRVFILNREQCFKRWLMLGFLIPLFRFEEKFL